MGRTCWKVRRTPWCKSSLKKAVTYAIAEGTTSCSYFYPLSCGPFIDPPTYVSCNGTFGLIECKTETGCPAFFNPDATPKDDKVSGGVVFFIGILITFPCMACSITILHRMLLGRCFNRESK